MELPTFAAERRLLRSAGARRCRPICPARGALSSKLAARRSGCRTMGQTDGRTDVGPLRRACCAYCAGSGDDSCHRTVVAAASL